jgi:hypothetical protein
MKEQQSDEIVDRLQNPEAHLEWLLIICKDTRHSLLKVL